MEQQSITELFERKEKFQHELNEVLSHYLSGDEVAEGKQLISEYYAKKLTAEIDKLAAQKGWTQETCDGWLQEHLCTPYNKP